ncbi:hypothetical protein [Mycolicibacterium palauense]|uniref:hypothetical protein n=1 Tax=Mycolicibacterium palauense TaxID=2034511 RepID=UPI00159B91B7|nr:hypothetical protein [Mycolicibacterium palauense]
MTNLEMIPAPAPDCTDWRTICDGHYRLFANGTHVQFAYPDGHHWSTELDPDA